MKYRDIDIDKELEHILESGTKRGIIRTSPFFTTRIMGKIEQVDSNRILFKKITYILKPVMIIIVFVNVFNFFSFQQSKDMTDSQNEYFDVVVDEYAYANSDFIISDEFLNED